MSTSNQEESKGPEPEYEKEMILSEEDVLSEFNVAQKIWMEYEDCQNNTPFEDTIVLLKKIEQSIIHHSMFSPNEPLKDLKTEYIKYQGA
jgi:TAP42-like family